MREVKKMANQNPLAPFSPQGDPQAAPTMVGEVDGPTSAPVGPVSSSGVGSSVRAQLADERATGRSRPGGN